MADDWFRSPAWDDAAKEDFEERLARSRPHKRSQYLRIKALGLIDSGLGDEGLRLLQRVLNDHPDSLDARHALELTGDVLRQQGDLVGAIAAYRRLMTTDLNATTGEVEISLAEALFEQRGADAVTEVRELLRDTKITWNTTLFRALLLSSRAAEAIGDRDLQESEAARAIELLGAPPQLAHKPDVGVPNPSDGELSEVTRLASGRRRHSWWRRTTR